MKPFTVSYLHPTEQGWRLENHYIVSSTRQTAVTTLARQKRLKFKATGTGQYRGDNGSVLYIERHGPEKPTLESFHDLPPLPPPAPEPAPASQPPAPPQRQQNIYKLVDVDYTSQEITEYWLQAPTLLEAAALSPAMTRRFLTASGATRFQTENGFVLIYENPPHTC